MRKTSLRFFGAIIIIVEVSGDFKGRLLPRLLWDPKQTYRTLNANLEETRPVRPLGLGFRV